jgi:hypothetical protein
MNKQIDIIKPHVRHFCKDGYLDDSQRKTLYDLSDQYQIPRKDVDKLVTEELKQAQNKHLECIYTASGQPDAALHEAPDLFTESKRQFPEMLNVGKLCLSMNDEVEAPAFIPIKGSSGIMLLHKNLNEDNINNFLQNITVRLILSLPRNLVKITLIDPVNMGGSFINLSGLDNHFLDIIDDEKTIHPFLQNCRKDMASFSFKELGSNYSDINAYNKANRSKARLYHVILCSDLSDYFDDNANKELIQVFKLANRAGLFFLSAAKSNSIKNKEIYAAIKENTIVINQNDAVYEVLSKVNLTLFNKAYVFSPKFDCVFDSNIILKINNEYDSQKYPLEKTTYTMNEMKLFFGKDKKENEICIIPAQQNDNMLLISEQRSNIETMLKCLFIKLSDTYNTDELKIIVSNSDVLPENSDFPVIHCNVRSNKYHYIYGVLKKAEQIITQRKTLFQKEGIADYQTYLEQKKDKLPKWLFVIDNIEKILDSDNLHAIEIPQILDTVLSDSVKYGIYILVAGTPTYNLLKLNLSGDFNYKLFVESKAETIESVTANTVSEDNLKHVEQSLQGIVLKESSSTVTRFFVTLYDNNEIEKKVRALVSDISKKTLSQPPVFVDDSDEYPELYRQINLKQIALRENHFVVGISRFFADSFYALPFEKDEKVSKLLIMGDAKSDLKILTHSLDIAREKQLENVELKVFDIALANISLREQLSSFAQRTNFVDGTVKGFVCLLNMDEYDYSDSEEQQFIKDFIANADNEGIYLLFHAKNDSVFQTDHLGEITRTCFEHKIALKDAPDDFISPILYFKNADFIHAPQEAFEIIYEGTDDVSGFGIDNVWLINNKE